MRVSTKMTAMQVRSTRSKMKLDSIATTTATTEGGGVRSGRERVFGGLGGPPMRMISTMAIESCSIVPEMPPKKAPMYSDSMPEFGLLEVRATCPAAAVKK